MQEYEGYFENGHFYPIGQTVRVIGRRKAKVTIFDEPEREPSNTVDEDIAKRLAALAECDRIADEAPDEELRMEAFRRFDFGRDLILFHDEEY